MKPGASMMAELGKVEQDWIRAPYKAAAKKALKRKKPVKGGRKGRKK